MAVAAEGGYMVKVAWECMAGARTAACEAAECMAWVAGAAAMVPGEGVVAAMAAAGMAGPEDMEQWGMAREATDEDTAVMSIHKYCRHEN